MKGLVFTEFLEMVEEKFGYVTVDKIIESSELPSGGKYTSIGNYSHRELMALVTELSKIQQIPTTEIMKSYGHHLIEVFIQKFGVFFEETQDVFKFYQNIDQFIHLEVSKQNVAENQHQFEFVQSENGADQMIYYSKKKIAFLAEGLFAATLEHFKAKATLEKEEILGEEPMVKFIISKI